MACEDKIQRHTPYEQGFHAVRPPAVPGGACLNELDNTHHPTTSLLYLGTRPRLHTRHENERLRALGHPASLLTLRALKPHVHTRDSSWINDIRHCPVAETRRRRTGFRTPLPPGGLARFCLPTCTPPTDMLQAGSTCGVEHLPRENVPTKPQVKSQRQNSSPCA